MAMVTTPRRRAATPQIAGAGADFEGMDDFL
jgi:hypothetical protein